MSGNINAAAGKIRALALCCVVLLATVSAFFCATGGASAVNPERSAAAEPLTASASAPAASAATLLSSLPPSDLVLFIDTQRALTEALPAFLADKPEKLAKLNAEIDSFRDETGIDPRSFDMVAAGFRYLPHSTIRGVAIARGRFSAEAVINSARTAAVRQKTGFQLQGQEEYKGRTLFILSSSSATPARRHSVNSATGTSAVNRGSSGRHAPVGASPRRRADQPHARRETAAPCAQGTPCDSAAPERGSVTVNKHAGERTAIVALDANTLAVGDLESLRATIDAGAGGPHADDTLVQLATRNTSALVGFSGNVPASLSQEMSGENDRFLKLLGNARQVYGSLSTTGAQADTALSLRMETPEQARELKELISAAILMSGAGGDGDGGNPMDLLKNLTVAAEGNDLLLQLRVTQEDILHLRLMRF